MNETRKSSRFVDLTPPAVTVRLEVIKPEEGSWACAVGARDTVTMVYEGGIRRGIAFKIEDGWQIAATGHERYVWPGRAVDVGRDAAIWFLCKANHIVIHDSPKYKEGQA